MPTLTLLIVVAVAVAVFLTTPAGKRLAARAGLRIPGKGNAPQQDHDYLLRVCNGDFDELQSRLQAARRNNPNMTEAETYRRAIRTHLHDKM